MGTRPHRSPERKVSLLAEDADARRLLVHLEHNGIDTNWPRGHRRVAFQAQQLSALAHHVRARGRVRLTGLLLAFADDSLQVSMGGHRRFSSLCAASAPALGCAAKIARRASRRSGLPFAPVEGSRGGGSIGV